MTQLRLGLLVIACFALATTARAAPAVKLDTKGVTNENNAAKVSYVVTEGKLTVLNWLVELVIDGNNINVANCTITQSDMGTKGTATAPINLKAGTYKVKIKVKLSDDSTVTDERDVTFFKEDEGSPPPPPPFLPWNFEGEILQAPWHPARADLALPEDNTVGVFCLALGWLH
ncbi:MAG: hypothetical protein HYX68_07435 [Planctomycetes bacterium]|nr:hypothetical protein [Planctomycetota bacterium]